MKQSGKSCGHLDYDYVLTRRHFIARPRPKNDADREWQAQKPMRDDLSNATDEDGEADDGNAGLLHDFHDVHRGY